MLKLGVLGSGKGSNLQAIIDAIEQGRLDANIEIVISDVRESFILKRAEKHGIRACYIDPGQFKTKLDPETEQKYVNCLNDSQVDLICLAGFLRVLKECFLSAFPLKIINIHPSLLPSFPGLKAWKQALDYGVKISGCTVHFVEAGVDTGPIIIQKQVPVYDNDTYEDLLARIQEQEHIAYPEAIALIGTKKIKITGRKVLL